MSTEFIFTKEVMARLSAIADVYSDSPKGEVMEILMKDFQNNGKTKAARFKKDQQNLAAKISNKIKKDIVLLNGQLDDSSPVGKHHFTSSRPDKGLLTNLQAEGMIR